MAWFNQISSQIQTFAQNNLDPEKFQDESDGAGRLGGPNVQHSVESLLREKASLEESLLQLDNQHQEEMSKLIRIKDDFHQKLKKAEAELAARADTKKQTSPGKEQEISLDDDWDNGFDVTNTFDERSSEILDLRSALEEAQRQLASLSDAGRSMKNLQQENVVLKNKISALEEENEMLEKELGEPSTDNVKTVKERESDDYDYEGFCKEVVTVLLGGDELSKDKLQQAKEDIQILSTKIKQIDVSTENVSEGLARLQDQNSSIRAEKEALRQELERLSKVDEELKETRGQLLKAKTDKDSLAQKIQGVKREEAELRQQIEALSSKETDESTGNGKDEKIAELENLLLAERERCASLEQDMKTTKEDLEAKIQELSSSLADEKESKAPLENCIADLRSQLDIVVSRENALMNEMDNLRHMAEEQRSQTHADEETSALLLKKTRVQESEIQELRGQLHLAQESEAESKTAFGELECKFNALSEDLAELSALKQRLATNEQELELMKHGRDSVQMELENARQELDVCQQKLMQNQMEATAITEASASAALQKLTLERDQALSTVAILGQDLEAMQIARKELDKSLQLLTDQKEHVVAVAMEKTRESTELKSQLDSLMKALANEKSQRMEALLQLDAIQKEMGDMRLQKQSQPAPEILESSLGPLQQTISALENENQSISRTLSHKNQENTELRQRIQKLLENEDKLRTEIQRLSNHLVEVEESYTKEALEAEAARQELHDKLVSIEESARYTDNSAQAFTAQASQRVEMLQSELVQATSQRDEALDQVSTLEDQIQQSQASLASLQLVLEHMQAERDNGTKSLKKHNEAEQKRLTARIKDLETELAAKLSTIDAMNATIASSEQTVRQLEERTQDLRRYQQKLTEKEEELRKSQERCRKFEGSEGKVEKQLMKNMLIGYFSAPPDKKNDVLRFITGCLEFSEAESRKVVAATENRGFIGSLFGAPPALPVGDPNDSFTSQLIAYVEKESTPNAPLKLPTEQSGSQRKISTSSISSLSERRLTSSPFRPDNPLFNHLPPSPIPTTNSDRASTASEPEMLRELLGQPSEPS